MVSANATQYLDRLTARILRGIASTPDAFRARHRGYILAAQEADGGFPGRAGGSDLYYTGFALRALVCVGPLDPRVRDAAAGWLRSVLQQPASVVDFMSLLYAARLVAAAGGADVLSESGADWRPRVAAALEAFRKPDGGYGKTTEGTSGSTYHTFLVALCYELIMLPMPQPDRIVAFLRSRRREDGGYVEVAPARRGGTNPTAAAVALLLMHGALEPEQAAAVAEFLAGMQAPDGGLRANDRAPCADLLSTFTAVVTLADLGAAGRIDRAMLARFLADVELPAGGFRAGTWDAAADVEYTFYGLGTTALLSDT